MMTGMASGMIMNISMNWLTMYTWKHSPPLRSAGQKRVQLRRHVARYCHGGAVAAHGEQDHQRDGGHHQRQERSP